MSAAAVKTSPTSRKQGFKFGRLLWTLFVVLYLINFFKNFFADIAAGEAFLPTLYFTLCLLWLGVEFFFETLFYQSGLVESFNFWLKTGFAVYFYGLHALVGWDAFAGTQVRFLFPILNIVGLIVLLAGIAVRLWALFAIQKHKKNLRQVLSSPPWKWSRHPRYIGMLLIMFAVPLVFFSPWGMLATVVIGLPLWYLSIRWEERSLLKDWGNIYENYLAKTSIYPRFKR